MLSVLRSVRYSVRRTSTWGVLRFVSGDLARSTSLAIRPLYRSCKGYVFASFFRYAQAYCNVGS